MNTEKTLKQKLIEASPEVIVLNHPNKFWILTKFLFKAGVFTSLIVGFMSAYIWFSMQVTRTYEDISTYTFAKAEELKYQVATRFDLVKYTTHLIPAERASVRDLVKIKSKKYGIQNPLVLWVMVDKESNNNPNRIRFEQTWKDQYSKKFPRQKWMNDIEYDMQFSSYGLTQIGYPVWKEELGIQEPTELLDPEVNLDKCAYIMSKCLKEHEKKIPQPGLRLWTCWRKYNGSGSKAEAYANDLMAKFGQYTADDRLLTSDTDADIAPTIEVNNIPEVSEVPNENGPSIPSITTENGSEITPATLRQVFQGLEEERQERLRELIRTQKQKLSLNSSKKRKNIS